jgi:putative endonuclease
VQERQYYVYILTNNADTVFYTGVTNDLTRRVSEHRMGLSEGFSARYHLSKLVYYEATGDVNSAIMREKQIKGIKRQEKIDLIVSLNPGWSDLADDFMEK